MGFLPPVQGSTVLSNVMADALPTHANAGLVFQRYLRIWNGDAAKPDKSESVRQDLETFVRAFNARATQGASLLSEHHARLDRLGSAHWQRSYKTQYRLTIGLGEQHPLENGFLFDYVLGIPYIPGSSIKGMLRAYLTVVEEHELRDRLLGREGDEDTRAGAQQGELVVLPAFPRSWPKLAVDVINCHHPDYYSDRRSTPVDWENPNPVFFLVVETGVEFVFRLAAAAAVTRGQRDAIVAEAHPFLEQALGIMGVGAKTAVGYGVMQTGDRYVPRSKIMAPDPSGYYFISYSRENAEDATRVEHALHELGMPTWRDIHDLPTAQTEREIRRVLKDPRCVGAVVLVTRDVQGSDFVRKVEAPLILERGRRDSAFHTAIVAVGVHYKEVDTLLGPESSLVSLAGLNMVRSETAPLPPSVAAACACKLLKQRLARVAAELPSEATLRVDVSTRVPAAAHRGIALSADYSHLFDGRRATDEAWSARILPALHTLRSILAGALRGPHRTDDRVPAIELSGQVAIPMAIALGTTFLATSELRDVAWLQPAHHGRGTLERWSLSVPGAESGFVARTYPDNLNSEYVALLVSAGPQPVENDFRRCRASLPALRAIVSIEPSDSSPKSLTPATARDVAARAIDALVAARREYGGNKVHLFFGGPIGLAFMLGQLFNTFSEVHTYEYSDSHPEEPYTRAAVLRPSA